jgi:hypothetical protein
MTMGGGLPAGVPAAYMGYGANGDGNDTQSPKPV